MWRVCLGGRGYHERIDYGNRERASNRVADLDEAGQSAFDNFQIPRDITCRWGTSGICLGVLRIENTENTAAPQHAVQAAQYFLFGRSSCTLIPCDCSQAPRWKPICRISDGTYVHTGSYSYGPSFHSICQGIYTHP